MKRRARRLAHFGDPKLEVQIDELVRAQNEDVAASEAHEARTDNPHQTTPEQIGAETPAGAQGKVDAHAEQVTGVHGVGTNRVAKTSRVDQWPDWADIQGKPASYPPSPHAATHAAGASDPVTPAAIGAETPSGAQAKADLAEANAKAYTDAHAARSDLHVTAAYRAAMDHAAAPPSDTNPFVTEETLNNAMTGSAKPGVATLADLAAIPPEQRADKDTRLVEEDGRIYRFDAEATSGDVRPNVGTGYWIAVAAATQNHNNLANLQGGNATERYHLTQAEHDTLVAHPSQKTGVHGVGADYIAKTSRADQWPDWSDVQNKPAAYPPIGHAASHAAGGADPVTPASIGAETPAGAQAKADAVQSALNTHKTAATLDHPDGSVTDAKVGNRTVDQAQAPTGNTGTLTQILSWLANRIRAITGAANWYDAPATTLAAAKSHMDAAAPHSGHETPSGAQSKVDTHAAVTTGVHGVGTYRVAKSSRTDQWPDWADVQNKPSSFTPSAHKSTHASGGSDALTPADIGAVNKAGDSLTGALGFRIGGAGPFYHRNAASYTSDAANVTGAFVIETPVVAASESTMMRMLIEGYFYDSTSPFWLLVGGYIYSPGPSFHNHGYINLGKKRPLVRWGRNTATGKVVLILGDVADVHQYPKLWVSLLEGYSGAKDAHRTGWSVSLKTSLTGYDLLTTVPDVGAFFHTGNDGAGSGLDADLVRGRNLAGELDTHKSAATLDHPDGSVTDAKIGNRTADQTQAPTGSTGTLTQLFSWVANRIKAITGTTNWYDAPATTLAAAKSHMDAAAPHSGHETPAGAQAKVDAHAARTDNPHATTAAQTGAVANAGAVPSIQAGPLGSRPAAGVAGRLYLDTDTLHLFRDTGTAWVDVIAEPRGTIKMWSGSVADIPLGYCLCDGQPRTLPDGEVITPPDLRDRFIVGAGGAYNPADTGGEAAHVLTVDEMPAHSHGASTSSAGSHSHSGTTSSNGNHAHSITLPGRSGNNAFVNRPAAWGYDDWVGANASASTNTTGAHTHSFSTNTAGAHTHGVTVEATGGGAAHENRPPYYALCFIMRL